jgi:hypothetical protein
MLGVAPASLGRIKAFYKGGAAPADGASPRAGVND